MIILGQNTIKLIKSTFFDKMNFFTNLKVKEFSIFFWIILISILGIITASIYNNAKEIEIKQKTSNIDDESELISFIFNVIG